MFLAYFINDELTELILALGIPALFKLLLLLDFQSRQLLWRWRRRRWKRETGNHVLGRSPHQASCLRLKLCHSRASSDCRTLSRLAADVATHACDTGLSRNVPESVLEYVAHRVCAVRRLTSKGTRK